MDYAIFLAVLLLQTSMILYPEWLNAALFLPCSAGDEDGTRDGMVPIAAHRIAALCRGVFFDATYKDHPLLFPAPNDSATIPARYIAGAVVCDVRDAFCIVPARTLKARGAAYAPCAALESQLKTIRG